MTDCVATEMRDVLPDLIHGSLDAARAAAVESHIASCVECASEIMLLRVVAGSAPRAPALDVNRIAAALPTPTRQGLLLHNGGGNVAADVTTRKPSVWSRPLLRVAATVAIVTAGGLSLLVGRDVLHPERQVGALATKVIAAVPSPTAATSQTAAIASTGALAQTPTRVVASAAGLSLGGEVRDLSDEHLATLLSEMDGMDGLPGAEPEVIVPVIGVIDTAGLIP